VANGDTPQTGPLDTTALATAAGAPSNPPPIPGATAPPPQTPGLGQPAIFELMRAIAGKQQQPDQMARFNQGLPAAAPVSRAQAFEHFLGTFLTAFSAGLQAPPGPGANERAAGAALMAPYHQAVQNFQLQQQARAQQAATQEAQARTGLYGAQAEEARVRTGLAPQEFQIQKDIKEETLKLQQIEAQARIDYQKAFLGLRGQQVDINRQNADTRRMQEQFNQQIATGKLNVAKELANYRGMDVANQIQYRQVIAGTLVQKSNAYVLATDANNRYKTAATQEAQVKAANEWNIAAKLGRAIGLDENIPDIPLANAPRPSGAPINPNSIRVTGGGNIPPSANNPYRQP